jgi:hypothetical protein
MVTHTYTRTVEQVLRRCYELPACSALVRAMDHRFGGIPLAASDPRDHDTQAAQFPDRAILLYHARSLRRGATQLPPCKATSHTTAQIASIFKNSKHRADRRHARAEMHT